MEAARAVFSEKGLDYTRIDEITERADVGKGTFYYHFGGKEELIRELIQDLLSQLIAHIDKSCQDVTELDALLDRLIGAHIEFFSNQWEDFVLFFQGRTELTLEEAVPGIETPFIAYLARIEDLLAGAIRYRLPRPVLRRVACAIAGFVSGYYSFAVISAGDEDVDSVFHSLRRAMVISLARFVKETLQQEAQTPNGSPL